MLVKPQFQRPGWKFLYELFDNISAGSLGGGYMTLFQFGSIKQVLYKVIRIEIAVNINISPHLLKIYICIIFNVAVLIIKKLENQMELQNSNRLLNWLLPTGINRTYHRIYQSRHQWDTIHSISMQEFSSSDISSYQI